MLLKLNQQICFKTQKENNNKHKIGRNTDIKHKEEILNNHIIL